MRCTEFFFFRNEIPFHFPRLFTFFIIFFLVFFSLHLVAARLCCCWKILFMYGNVREQQTTTTTTKTSKVRPWLLVSGCCWYFLLAGCISEISWFHAKLPSSSSSSLTFSLASFEFLTGCSKFFFFHFYREYGRDIQQWSAIRFWDFIFYEWSQSWVGRERDWDLVFNLMLQERKKIHNFKLF